MQPSSTATFLDKQLINKIASDSLLKYVAYASNYEYIKYRAEGKVTNDRKRVDTALITKAIEESARYYFHYVYLLQQKYSLKNTNAYIKEALQLYSKTYPIHFVKPDAAAQNKLIVMVCPAGLVFNPVILLCDYPQNVPNGSEYYMYDDETGVYYELMQNVTLPPGASCYSRFFQSLWFVRFAYPCGYSLVFGNMTDETTITNYMTEHPLGETCQENTRNYLYQIYGHSESECYNIGGGGSGGSGGYIPSYYDIAVPPFTWMFNGDDGTTFTDPDPLDESDFQFDSCDNYETAYPRFTNMAKNLKTFVKNNNKVLNALQTYSGFSKQQILNHLTFGQGPTIKIEEMAGRFGFYNVNNGSNTLHIKASYVRGLEQAFLQSTQEATAFLLAVTILHEYIHLGTTQNNISEGVYDFGYGFERDAFNVIVDDNNAGIVVIRFSQYF